MAFDLNRIAVGHGYSLSTQNIWKYDAGSDDQATVEAADYFLAMNDKFQVNDLLYISMDDDAVVGLYTVQAVSSTTVTITAYGAVPVVGTANIDNLAVTTAKIDNLAVTDAKLAADSVITAKIADDAVTSAKLDEGVRQVVKVSLSSANWLGMYATPVQIIAAPGANKAIIIESVALEVDYGGAQFAAGGVVALQYSNTANGAGTAATATLAAATANGWAADTIATLAPATLNAGAAATVNVGIFISNQTAAFTTGSSTVDVHVAYRVITTTL